MLGAAPQVCLAHLLCQTPAVAPRSAPAIAEFAPGIADFDTATINMVHRSIAE